MQNDRMCWDESISSIIQESLQQNYTRVCWGHNEGQYSYSGAAAALHSGNSVKEAVAKFTVVLILASKGRFISVHLFTHPSLKAIPRYLVSSYIFWPTPLISFLPNMLPTYIWIQLHEDLSSLFSLSCIDRSPSISINAVNAARPIGSGGNIIQICSKHTRASRTRAIDLGGGIEQTLVSQLLPAKSCSDGWGKVDVTFIWLIHLWLVREKDLGLRTVGEKKEVKWRITIN